MMIHTRSNYPHVRISIVTNGSKLTRRWLEKHRDVLDILAVSIDSFEEEVSREIGRVEGGKVLVGLEKMLEIAGWCEEFGIGMKVNTVLNALNWEEDMNQAIAEIDPFRWKVFQVLLLDDENNNLNPNSTDTTTTTTRGQKASKYSISSTQYNSFISRHSTLHNKILVPEPNDVMQNSYILLDEYLRFLNCSSGGKVPGRSILEVGVEEAMKEAGFDEEKFVERGGDFMFEKPGGLRMLGRVFDSVEGCQGLKEELQW
ncbi:hypothetical protein HDU76_002774 [Blyttiomyces sp. JEL0837]|nr:hypothetical protein HDU76_002774 [Blyttiomyces sp. JEL0837]